MTVPTIDAAVSLQVRDKGIGAATIDRDGAGVGLGPSIPPPDRRGAWIHAIVTGTTSVEEARKTYAETMAGFTLGRSAPLAERFQFEVPQGGTEDPDESMIGGAMVRQTLGTVKDVLTGSPDEPTGR